MSESIVNDSLEKGRKSRKSSEPHQDVMKLEFARLHKEYRTLEHKRHNIAQRDGYIRMRTDRLIPIFEQEHTELSYELGNATCRAHKKKASRLAYGMKSALKTFDLYQSELKRKIKQILEIEQHVDRITDKVVKQRFKLLALHGLSRTLAQRENDLMKAENKLYQIQCGFNLQIHENKKLRDEIMDFLTERGRFFKMHNSTKRQIAHTKKKMLAIVQQAIHTYDNRDEAMSKVKTLREREAKEVKQHGMEVQEFERTLHHDRSILDFVKTKLKNRPAYEDAIDRRIRLGSAKERELDAILRKYKKSFKKILEYSETKSILDLVDRYNHLNNRNFEQFQFLTQLNHECEVLKTDSERLKTQIENAHSEVENREHEQRKAQKLLQLAIMHEHDKMRLMEKQQTEDRRRDRDIFATIAAAMSLTNCNVGPIMRLLGNKEGIDAHNVRLCLTQLDIRITEIKFDHDRLKDLKSNASALNAAYKAVIQKTKVIPSQGGPFIPKMMMFHGESVDEEDTKIFEQEPFYYDEMKEYVFQKMIEDGQVDVLQRSISVTSKRKSVAVSATITRKTLAQRIEQSKSEMGGGRRRRKRNHHFSSEFELSTTSTNFEEEAETVRRKTEHIVRIGEDVQHHLLRSSTTESTLSHYFEHHHPHVEFRVDPPPPDEDLGHPPTEESSTQPPTVENSTSPLTVPNSTSPVTIQQSSSPLTVGDSVPTPTEEDPSNE